MTTEIMFQLFKWDATHNGRIGDWYEYLKTKVSDLSEAGITHVWFPPPSKSRAQDWVGYTPMDYYDLGEFRQWVQIWDEQAKKLVWMQHSGESSRDLDDKGNMTRITYIGTETLWGHKDELVDLINVFKSKQIKCIADIVINHRDPQQVNAQDEWISWGSDEHVIASNKMVWGYKGKDDDPEEISYLSGGSTEDDGEGGFSANIAHRSVKARKDIKDWMLWLKETIGFDGWRYDLAKGFGPEHLGEYNYHTGNPFSVGEYWDTNTQLVYDWIDRTDAYDVAKKSRAFDFALQEHLRKTFWGTKSFDQLGLWKYSSVSVLGGWPEKVVTFLDNHDTARKPFSDFPTDAKRLIQGYVFLLTHPGCPCIFFSHYYERGAEVHDTLKELCKLRVENRIPSNAFVEVVRSEGSCYVAKVNDRLLVKIGDEFWGPQEDGWKLQKYGNGWAIWIRS